MGSYTTILSAEEEKALLSNMISIQAWIDNAIYNKARQVIDDIVEKYADGKLELEVPFTVQEEKAIEDAKEGKIVFHPRSFPRHIKEIIVKKVKVKTAKERNDEIEELRED